jgi:hypothetical protein
LRILLHSGPVSHRDRPLLFAYLLTAFGHLTPHGQPAQPLPSRFLSFAAL